MTFATRRRTLADDTITIDPDTVGAPVSGTIQAKQMDGIGSSRNAMDLISKSLPRTHRHADPGQTTIGKNPCPASA
jgi:hypothetical protein